MSYFQRDSSIESPIQSPSSSIGGKTSPAIVFLLAIVAIVFILCGLLHLLVRFITKSRPSFLASSQHPPENEIMSRSDTFQRQLHHLFQLHDSGLDQAQIDALPVFHYKEMMGLNKDPFDCAVCLCEFSEQDTLRLVPHCSHAFHVDCIDTWLLSNSTCPLCRGSLATVHNPPSEFQDSTAADQEPNQELEIVGQKIKVVLPVRLGKFRNTDSEKGEVGDGSSSSSNLGARRCYSMGSYQYVVADSLLQVTLSSQTTTANHLARDVEGKRISIASKNESLSVSKIWLWSNKGKFPGSSHIHM